MTLNLNPALSVIEQMDKSKVYSLYYQGPKNRMMAVGYYTGHDEKSVMVETKQGTIRKVPIDAIFHIAFYHKAPF